MGGEAFNRLQKWMGKHGDDGYDNFIYKWIAFNTAYNLFYLKDNPSAEFWKKEHSERIRVLHIKDILKQNILKQDPKGDYKLMYEVFQEEAPNFFSLLSKFAIYKFDKKNQIDLVTELTKSEQKGDYSEIISNILDIIYSLRCDLFHGLKALQDEEVNNLLEDSSKIVYQIMAWILFPYFNDK